MSESFLKVSITEDEEESYLIFSPVLTWQREWQLIPELAELPYSALALASFLRFLCPARYFPQSEFDVFSPRGGFAELSTANL